MLWPDLWSKFKQDNTLKISEYGHHDHGTIRYYRYYAAIWFSDQWFSDQRFSDEPISPDRKFLAIAWETVKLKNPDKWKSIVYFNMLPDGYIPQNGADFLSYFIRHLRKAWLKLCDTGETNLTLKVSRAMLISALDVYVSEVFTNRLST